MTEPTPDELDELEPDGIPVDWPDDDEVDEDVDDDDGDLELPESDEEEL
jgi:hypothetical protein